MSLTHPINNQGICIRKPDDTTLDTLPYLHNKMLYEVSLNGKVKETNAEWAMVTSGGMHKNQIRSWLILTTSIVRSTPY